MLLEYVLAFFLKLLFEGSRTEFLTLLDLQQIRLYSDYFPNDALIG